MNEEACEKGVERTVIDAEKLLPFFLIFNIVVNSVVKELSKQIENTDAIDRAEKMAKEILGGIKKDVHIPKPRGRKPRLSPEQVTEANARRNELFNKFWEKYPRKEGEAGARRWWLRIPNLELIFPKIMGALEWQVAQWESGKFAPPPVKYILDKRWEDEPIRDKKRVPSVFGDIDFPTN